MIRRAAAEGIVLLKNEQNILPLKKEALTSIAIIGPNAKETRIMDGGSAHVNAHYVVTPYDGIMNKLGDFVNVDFAQGCTNHRLLPALKPEWLTPVGGELGTGLTIGYFNNLDLSGEPVWSTVTKHTRQMWLGQIGPNVNPSPTRRGKEKRSLGIGIT